jgi:hypothetical protein
MRKPVSVRSLEQLGRVRLSSSFFMREFLHSEIADLHGIPNIPDDPALAIAAGRRLCEELLEPLQATFGRLAIRSAYRAPAVNAFGNAHGPELRVERAELCPPHLGSARRSRLHGRAGHGGCSLVCRSIRRGRRLAGNGLVDP